MKDLELGQNPKMYQKFGGTEMKNYRIKKVKQDGGTYYYPQKKVLFWWEDIFGVKNDGYFDTLEEAKYHLKHLLSADTKTYVEYLYFD